MGRGLKRHSKVIWPGFSNTPVTRHAVKVGRNQPCPCGSQQKYKDCHEKDGSAFLEKLALQEDKQRLRELRLRLKQEGVPWWRRFFFRL